jgi:hypothetical protein
MDPELARFGASAGYPNTHRATQSSAALNRDGGQIIQHFHMAVNVRATDAPSIQRSRAQIEQQMAVSLRRAASRMAT